MTPKNRTRLVVVFAALAIVLPLAGIFAWQLFGMAGAGERLVNRTWVQLDGGGQGPWGVRFYTDGTYADLYMGRRTGGGVYTVGWGTVTKTAAGGQPKRFRIDRLENDVLRLTDEAGVKWDYGRPLNETSPELFLPPGHKGG